MASNDIVRARIDRHIREEPTNVLAEMGMSASDPIRMLLTRIAAGRALPFDINRAQRPSDTERP
jgi:DNA-damage-inducible protein J